MSESDEDDPFQGLVLSGELSVEKKDWGERFGRGDPALEREIEHAERDLERLEEYRRDRDVDGG